MGALVFSIIQSLIPVAIVGGIGFAVYKGINNISEGLKNKKNLDLSIDYNNNLDYIYAIKLFNLLKLDGFSYSKDAIIKAIKEAAEEGVNWINLKWFYAQLTKNKEFEGECYLLYCNRKYDASGNLDLHLQVALDERYNEYLQIIYNH